MRRLRGNLGYVEISAQTQFAGTHTTPEQVSMLSRELWVGVEGLQNWLADMRAASSLALNVAGCSQACASNRFIKSCGVQCGAKEAGLKTCGSVLSRLLQKQRLGSRNGFACHA